jgi:hypothetical protein
MRNGNLIGSKNNISNSTASGIFRLEEQYSAIQLKTWPGTKITLDGISMNLDASNPISYPGTGNTWYDISGNNLHATGSTPITGQALQGNQPYSTASNTILNTDIHSIFFSIQITGSTGTWDKIFGYEPIVPPATTAATDRSPGIWRYPSNKLIHWRYDPGNTDSDFSSTATSAYISAGTEFSDNTWYYVGLSKNGATTSVYVNGIKLGDRTGIASPKTAGASAIKLYPGYTGTSKMRHLHIYNRILTDQEVLVNYNAIKSTLV